MKPLTQFEKMLANRRKLAEAMLYAELMQSRPGPLTDVKVVPGPLWLKGRVRQ